MESMFLWIVLFSGATVLLLGLFLVASEKELKKKRGEINNLLTRLDGAKTASAPAGSEAGANGAEASDLRVKNQELQKEMVLLQDDLAAAHRAIDELRSNHPAANGATLGEIQQLRNANSQLDLQVEELRRRLQASAAQLDTASAGDSGASERQTQLENALIDLKRQLEKSQTQVRQLESSPTPVVDASASEASHEEECQRLQARIAELEKDLSAGAEITHQLDVMKQRLDESEKLEQELRESLQRREDEIPQWQERVAASQAIKQRLLALQPVYDQLVAKQSSLIEHQRAYHGELKSFAQFLSAAHDGTIAAPTLIDLQPDQETVVPAALLHWRATPHHCRDGIGPYRPRQRRISAPGQTWPRYFPRFACSGGVWRHGGAVLEPERRAAGYPRRQTAAASSSGEKSRADANPAEGRALCNGRLARPVGKANDSPAEQSASQTKMQPAAAPGTYEVTRSTRVFAAPTEFAQQLGEIEPGLKVNVVNARDGWLEIHSKHGRPPGYIRGDTVARVGG